jgi:hypothetical protein
MLRSAADGREVKVVDVADLILSESHLLPAIRRDLDQIVCRRDGGAMLRSPVKGGTELRADLLDGGQGNPCIREERDEVMPEDVSDLMRHKDAVELQLKPFEMMTESAETLAIVRMHHGLHPDEFVNDFHHGSVGKVKSEVAVLGLTEIGKEAALSIRQMMPI